jgi:hypothetical protein
MSDWKHYTEIDFSDNNYYKFNIDTRDFHCSCQRLEDIDEPLKVFEALKKNPNKFILSKDELLLIIDRLYNESGGKGRWRYLMLDSPSKGVNGWQLKYLRIFRVEDGFIMCNSDNYALSKEVLSCKVNKEHLCYIDYKD